MGRRHDHTSRQTLLCQHSIRDAARLTERRNDDVIKLRESLHREALTADRVVGTNDAHETFLHQRLGNEIGREITEIADGKIELTALHLLDR